MNNMTKNLDDYITNQKNFILEFDRKHPIHFQENFWFLIEHLERKKITWFNEAKANDHEMCVHTLSLIWKTDPEKVFLRFETRERYKGWQYDEETDEYGIVIEDVYGFRLDRESTKGDINMDNYRNNDYTPDLSGLLKAWS